MKRMPSSNRPPDGILDDDIPANGMRAKGARADGFKTGGVETGSIRNFGIKSGAASGVKYGAAGHTARIMS